MSKITQKFVVLVKHSELMPTQDGLGKVRRPLPDTEETVVVELDLALIAKALGPVAVGNKRGYATAGGGLIKVRHLRAGKRGK